MTDSAPNPAEEPGSWPERRRRAESACDHLRESPTSADACRQVQEFAADQKWEVRKVIAESLTAFPDEVYVQLAASLCQDTNALVRAAAQRSVERRAPTSGAAPTNPGVLQAARDRIEAKYGPQAAEEAIRLAQKFTEMHLRSAVHDIKNILTYFKLEPKMLARAAALADEKRQVQRYRRGRHYLERLVEMMRCYSEDLTPVMKPESLREIARDAVESAYDEVRSQGRTPDPVEWVVEVPDIAIPVSLYHFSMALTNMVKNAVESYASDKNTFAPGVVTIRAEVEGDQLRIEVIDDGKGISPSDMLKRREFVPGGSSKKLGSGYGLPISRRYIEAHGGTLQITSVENEGTTVTIRISLDTQKGEQQ